MFRIIIIAALCSLATGCATSPVASSQAKPVPAQRIFAFQDKTSKSTASIIVTRDSGFLGGGCFLAFSLDGVRAGRFDPGETASFHVEPGEHLLAVKPDAEGSGLCHFATIENSARETILRENETKNFRIMMDQNGTADIQRTE